MDSTQSVIPLLLFFHHSCLSHLLLLHFKGLSILFSSFCFPDPPWLELSMPLSPHPCFSSPTLLSSFQLFLGLE